MFFDIPGYVCDTKMQEELPNSVIMSPPSFGFGEFLNSTNVHFLTSLYIKKKKNTQKHTVQELK